MGKLIDDGLTEVISLNATLLIALASFPEVLDFTPT